MIQLNSFFYIYQKLFIDNKQYYISSRFVKSLSVDILKFMLFLVQARMLAQQIKVQAKMLAKQIKGQARMLAQHIHSTSFIIIYHNYRLNK